MNQQLDVQVASPKSPGLLQRLIAGKGFVWLIAAAGLLIGSVQIIGKTGDSEPSGKKTLPDKLQQPAQQSASQQTQRIEQSQHRHPSKKIEPLTQAPPDQLHPSNTSPGSTMPNPNPTNPFAPFIRYNILDSNQDYSGNEFDYPARQTATPTIEKTPLKNPLPANQPTELTLENGSLHNAGGWGSSLSKKRIKRSQHKQQNDLTLRSRSSGHPNLPSRKKNNPISSNTASGLASKASIPYLGKAAVLYQPIPQPVYNPPHQPALSREAPARIAARTGPTGSDRAPSTGHSPATPASKRKKNIIQLGLDWNISLPTQGTDHYFQNSSGKTAFYQPVLPGVWIGYATAKNQRIRLIVNPWQSFQAGNKVLDTAIVRRTSPDTMNHLIKTRMIKSTSLQIGLQYQYSFAKNWSLGAGLNWQQQRRALVSNETSELQDNKTVSDSSFSIRAADPGWQHLKPGYLSGSMELSYQWKQFQIGAIAFLPISSPIKTASPKTLNTQLILRWRIR